METQMANFTDLPGLCLYCHHRLKPNSASGYCSMQCAAKDRRPDKGGEYIVFPLKDGESYCVSFKEGQNYEQILPWIDVPREFCKMKLWLEAHPEKRKLHREIPHFICNWLIRAAEYEQTSHKVRMQAKVGENKFGTP